MSSRILELEEQLRLAMCRSDMMHWMICLLKI